MHWLAKYIGIKYVPRGESLSGVDCWGLVRLVYRQEFGVELPEHPGIGLANLRTVAKVVRAEINTRWERLEAAKDGCVVALSHGHVIHHVGLWAEAAGGKIVHAQNDIAVVADSLYAAALKGIKVKGFYAYGLRG